MRISLVTTTINVPRALAAYRAIDSDVFFYVVGDKKTPDTEVVDFLDDIPNHAYYGADWQKNLGYACAPLLGWNTIARRNIGILEAVKGGAELIVLYDDDNFVIDSNHFADLQNIFCRDFAGVGVASANGWFDTGQLLMPAVRHRGLPLGIPSLAAEFRSVTGAKIGVAAGLWIGDADVDATNRIAIPPRVEQVTALAQAGIIIDHDTRTTFNAQNTTVRRDFAPCIFQMPEIGRYDDIFASLICQRVMREFGYHVHAGKPFTACWQNRSKASVIRDLEDEIFGMKFVENFARWLDDIGFKADMTPLDCTRRVYDEMPKLSWMPVRAVQAGQAFLDDMEKVL